MGGGRATDLERVPEFNSVPFLLLSARHSCSSKLGVFLSISPITPSFLPPPTSHSSEYLHYSPLTVCACLCYFFQAKGVVVRVIIMVIMIIMRIFFTTLHMLLCLQALTCTLMSADCSRTLTHTHAYVACIINTSETSVCKCHYVGGEETGSGPCVSDVMTVKEGVKKVGL